MYSVNQYSQFHCCAKPMPLRQKDIWKTKIQRGEDRRCTGEAAKKRRKKRRREVLELEEDDYDLLEENQVKVR